jgi:Fe-S-cluster containining protein
MRFKCDKKEPCIFCAECCRFREKNILDEKEELKVKKSLFLKTGTLYLFPFSRYTINITPKEKEILETEAKKNGVKINILPKKIFITEPGILIYDYFIDADVCPFLNSENRCIVYEKRPLICQQFPKVEYDNKEFKEFERNNLIIKTGYEKCLEYLNKNITSSQ